MRDWLEKTMIDRRQCVISRACWHLQHPIIISQWYYWSTRRWYIVLLAWFLPVMVPQHRIDVLCIFMCTNRCITILLITEQKEWSGNNILDTSPPMAVLSNLTLQQKGDWKDGHQVQKRNSWKRLTWEWIIIKLKWW